MRKVAVLQSNYIPWKGVFDIINSVDIFIFLEDVQYTEHDWRNRNKIYTKDGTKWLSVPVKNSGRRGQLICEVEIDNRTNWQRKHFNAFQMNYARAKYYKDYKWILNEIYVNYEWTSLSELNIYTTKLIANTLGIKTLFINSMDINAKGKKDDRIIDICHKLNATHYLSGPAAKAYIVPEKFERSNIKLEYIKYEYPTYKQLHNSFEHGVTILDLLFNIGPEAVYYIWGWKNESKNNLFEVYLK